MLQRTTLRQGLVRVQVMSSWSAALSVFSGLACGPRIFCGSGKRLTGSRQVRASGAVQNVIFFLCGGADAEVDDGSVGVGIGLVGAPDHLSMSLVAAPWVQAIHRRARMMSTQQDSLGQDFGAICLVAAIEIQIESFGLDGLDEVHVGTDKAGHGCGGLWWLVL